MKRKYSFLLLLLMLTPFIILVSSCEDDEVVRNEPPKIAFNLREEALQEMNLDSTAGTRIVGTVQSDAGLRLVQVDLLKTSGSETLMDVTEFTTVTGYLFVLDTLPAYYPDVTGYRVVAEDVQGRRVEKELSISAKGGTAGPRYVDFPETVINANVRPTVNLRPAIIGNVNSHWGVASVTYYLVNADGNEVEVGRATDLGERTTSYPVEFTPDYDQAYEMQATQFKIVAVDNRGNRTETSLDMQVIDAAPAPTVVFDPAEVVAADLKSSPTVEPSVSMEVEALEGLATVAIYKVLWGEDVQIGQTVTTFDDEFVYTTELSANDINYEFGLTAIKVIVTDIVGQRVERRLPVNVNADDPYLSVYENVILSAQGDRADAGQKTVFNATDGTAHHYTEPVDNEALARKIDFLLTDTNGEDNWAMFSPLGHDWLNNNFYKTVVWPYRNTTKLRLVEGAGEAFYKEANSATISGISAGTDFQVRLNGLKPGNVVFFETETGLKGLMLFKEVVLNDGKNDDFSINVKVANPR